MKKNRILLCCFVMSIVYAIVIFSSGCAQISAPTGGPKDSIPPQLVNASPALNTVNFKGNKITFSFNEYIEVLDVQNNVLVSPLPQKSPFINYKLKTVTVSLKDTLLPNTTYSINFGNAIKDVNEGNVLQNFTYVFSTGNSIDSLSLRGKILLAETGKTDSTVVALLYKNANDSSVQKRKPDYIARPNANGEFVFNNLSAGSFRLFALKDGDGNKYYSSKVEMFAFADNEINVSQKSDTITLYAFSEQKDNKNQPVIKSIAEKKLKYSSAITTEKQSLLDDLVLTFNNPIKKFEPAGIFLTDTNYILIPNTVIALDSTGKNIIVKTKWKQAANYKLIINKDAVADSIKNALEKTDTLNFTTKSEEEYGNIVLRFSALDFSKNPVLQFVQNEEVKFSYKLIAAEWSMKLFAPGEYEIRILQDENNNGKWDTGNFTKKIQPEKVIAINQKLSIRANWDNEVDVKL